MTIGINLIAQQNKRAGFVLRLSFPLVWAVVILWLSLIPSPPQLPGVLGWDKLLHAGAYGLLAVLTSQFLVFLTLKIDKACWSAGMIAICYGALMEILQLLVQTGRMAEWWDLFADAVGVFICCVIFRQIHRLACRDDADRDENHG